MPGGTGAVWEGKIYIGHFDLGPWRLIKFSKLFSQGGKHGKHTRPFPGPRVPIKNHFNKYSCIIPVQLYFCHIFMGDYAGVFS